MKVKSKIKNQKTTFDVHFYALIALYFFSLLIFGGFGELTILFTGLLLVIFLFKKKNVSINVSQGLYLIFSVWYFGCSIKNGIFIEPMIKGLVPFVAFLFWIYCSNIQAEKGKIIKSIVNGSVYVALFAILHCVTKSVELKTLYRLTFPFDYSNVCGLYFAVCFFWAKQFVPNKNFYKYVFVFALVMSQSVGAIILFVCAFTYELIKEKRILYVLLEVVVIIAFVIFMRHRVYESMGTFLERLLHMYDASLCITKNPISGIGALWWEFAKPYYQTGYYEARVIHSSIFSIGVSSGLFGIILFMAVCFLEFKKLIAKKQNLTVVLIIIIHSFVDFSLSFLSVCFVLFLSLPNFDDEKKYSVNHIFKKVGSPALALGMISLISFNMMSSYFQNSISQRSTSDICKVFNESVILKSSVRSSQSVAARLYSENNSKEKPIFKNFKYIPTEMTLYNSINSERREEYLLDCIKEQPYNTALGSLALSACSEDFESKADEVTDIALSELSFLGNKLYKLKGENK